MDETLIHYPSESTDQFDSMDADETPTFFVRPGLNLLLSQLYPYYEIVVFTAAVADYAEYFVSKIDPHHRVKHVLHRE